MGPETEAAGGGFIPLPVPPSLLGESPFWHPGERALYWIDIPGRVLNRFVPSSGDHAAWPLKAEPGSCAPLLGGGLLVAMRDGLWRFDCTSGERRRVAAPPYDPAMQRYNDGKADAQGRFWVGTIDDMREPRAALYRHADGRTQRMAEGITTSNGLAFSPDGRTMYWSDTKAHAIHAFDVDALDGRLSRRRLLRQFPARADGEPLARYGGRPDGAAVDSEGGYWCAMFEGQRLLRLSPEGRTLAEIPLPVRCPTMPCFGGDDLKTLFVTTGREKRPDDELERQPWAGRVLQVRVDIPGLPVNFARL
jgi:sugar lactone lactonase YvrE